MAKYSRVKLCTKKKYRYSNLQTKKPSLVLHRSYIVIYELELQLTLFYIAWQRGQWHVWKNGTIWTHATDSNFWSVFGLLWLYDISLKALDYPIFSFVFPLIDLIIVCLSILQVANSGWSRSPNVTGGSRRWKCSHLASEISPNSQLSGLISIR